MRLILTLLLICCTQWIQAQLNATLRGTLDYGLGVNDVWGYVAPDGTEYAIVGLDTAVSVVSLAEPTLPTEIGRTSGANSPWRDMKTYGNYAYAVADRGADGLTVIDLSALPDTVTYQHHTYEVPGIEKPFVRAHNIYIDTARGLAFTAGGDFDVNDGGILVFDLKADPARPPLIAVGPPTYAHDVYVRDSLMYASEIYLGELAIYNIADLGNIREVGRTLTPFAFTHNAWTDDEQRVVYTTDEKGDASVAAFDISDLSAIELLDEYRPLTSIGTNTIPHNVHVIDDYLSISYYTDGLRVVDASVPDNLIEVANYDTWDGPDGGFSGNWGAFPFLPSGLTLVSDRSSGLFVIDVDYRRAARIQGTVTDAVSGRPINAATVALSGGQLANDVTDARGDYATGRAAAGTAAISAEAVGYYPLTNVVSLLNGMTVQKNMQLQPRPAQDIVFEIRDATTDAPIKGAKVSLVSPQIIYDGGSDTLGGVAISEVYDYDFSVRVTAWGYRARAVSINGTDFDNRIIYLDPGYEDTFATDLGWSVLDTVRRGEWERGIPVGTSSGSVAVQPDGDSQTDEDDQAYITGLAGGRANANDVDRGTTILQSPVMDLSDYGDSTVVSYQYWYVNVPSDTTVNDSLLISLTNGQDTVTLASYTTSTTEWTGDTIPIGTLITFTDSMHLLVTAADDAAQDDLVEAGFDHFEIRRQRVSTSSADRQAAPETIEITAYPNPSPSFFYIAFDRPSPQAIQAEVFDFSGRRILSQPVPHSVEQFTIGQNLSRGGYLLRLSANGQTLRTLKLFKH